MKAYKLCKIFQVLLSILLLICLIPPVSAAPVSGVAGSETVEAKLNAEELQEKWGVEIVSLRWSAGGYILDFRYRVLDPGKAAPLADRRVMPLLIDQASNATMIVPAPAKVGALRNKPMQYLRDRVYFIQFANPGKFIKPGSLVTVAIGDFQARNIVVQ